MAVIIEENLFAKSIGETIKGSLNSFELNFLERSHNIDVNEGLLTQIFSDWIKLTKNIQKESANQHTNNLGFDNLENQKRFLVSVSTVVIEFFDRYSEFYDDNFQTELDKFKILCEAIIHLLEGFEAINASQKNSEAIQFLEQIYEGIDLIVDVIESRASNLPINILSVMKVIFIELPVKVQDILESYSPLENQDQKSAKKYLRQINRAVNSGIAKINDTVNTRENELLAKSEEELLKAQIESNFMPMQLIEFWLREDQTRILTKEEQQDTQLLMNTIDSHRNRPLFSEQ